MTDEDQRIQELHTKGIGGSMIPAIMGVSPFDTAYSLWARIIGLTPPVEETPQMARGKRFEHIVIEDLARRSQHEVKACGWDDLIVTDRYGFPMVAKLDAYVYDDDGAQVGEAKTTTWRQAESWMGEEPPVHVAAQGYWYTAAADCRRAYIACRWGLEDDDMAYFVQERNEHAIERMLSKARTFWNEYVVTREPPPVTGKKADVEAVKTVLARSKPIEVALPKELLADLDTYMTLKGVVAESEERLAEVTNRIKLAMGEGEAAQLGPYRVSWKSQSPKLVLESARLKAEQPDVWAKYTKEAQVSRPFIVKEAK